MADFPTLRFQQADATPDELAVLEARFAAGTQAEQDSADQRWACVSQGDLITELNTLRANGYFDEAPVEVVPDPTPLTHPEKFSVADVVDALADQPGDVVETVQAREQGGKARTGILEYEAPVGDED